MDLFKLPPTFKNRLRESEPLDEITLVLEVSFLTTGQVKFTDVTGRQKIVEFYGTNWSIDLLMRKGISASFSSFINNPKKIENQIVTLLKKVNGTIVESKSFNISAQNYYDGWFKLI